MSNKVAITIIIFLGLATHFAFFGHPNQVVFDEVHFGKFVSGYYTHEYFFDIHPPLGKLLIAGFGKLVDFKPEVSFASIGDKFPDDKYLALRFLPTLAGALLPLIIYFLATNLGLSRMAALTAGTLVALENALNVQSRFMLMDGFLFSFGFAALAAYFHYRKAPPQADPLAAKGGGGLEAGQARKLGWLVTAGILAALSASVKWTGMAFVIIPIAVEIFDAIKSRHWRTVIAKDLVFLIVVPFLVYFSLFALHFSLLTKSGQGDAFMSVEFQKTLEGSRYQNDEDLRTPTLLGKFLELNAEMYTSNQGLTATHPYSSKWYTWPFMTRAIFYWVDGLQRIYLIGNPVVWWASTVAVLTLILWLVGRRIKPDFVPIVLLGAYVLNMLPFVGVKRVMFLYHYFAALIFAILILVYLIDTTAKNPKRAFLGLGLLALVAFLYFAPFTYGLDMSPGFYRQHIWIKSWE